MEKHLKEIAKELRSIRIELQKNSQSNESEKEVAKPISYDELIASAGKRVTIK